MTDRTKACNDIRDMLATDYGRIWCLSDYDSGKKGGQHWMAVDAYATPKGVVILHRYYENGTAIGCDIYIPVANTNKADVTIEALKRFLEGTD